MILISESFLKRGCPLEAYELYYIFELPKDIQELAYMLAINYPQTVEVNVIELVEPVLEIVSKDYVVSGSQLHINQFLN